MTCLYSGDLLPNDFLQVIEQYSWPDRALMMGFTPVEARFERFVFDGAFLSQTEEGRIFCPTGELRWRHVQQMIRAVYLGKPPGPENLSDFSRELDGLSPSRSQFLLWGERTDTQNEWLEQQVPHRFSYPIDTAAFPRGRVALVVEDWRDRAGIPRFSRYHSIIEVKGGN